MSGPDRSSHSGAGPASTLAGIVVAAGSGQRLGAAVPKALVPLAGRPLIAWAAQLLARAGVAAPVVVYPHGYEDAFRAACAGVVAGESIASSIQVPSCIQYVEGGATRSASVRAGLAAIDPLSEMVIVHDAARPLMPSAVLAAAVAAVEAGAVAAAPSMKVADTLKSVEGRRITGTVAREHLVAIQTPQVFRRDVLDRVMTDDAEATDELALVEAAAEIGVVDGMIATVDGSPFGYKLTTAADLAFLEQLAVVPATATESTAAESTATESTATEPTGTELAGEA